MTTLQITPKTTRTAAAADSSVAVDNTVVSPLNNWTLHLKVWSFTGTSNNTNRARLQWEDSVNAFSASLVGPTYNIVPTINDPEGKLFTCRWRDFDAFRIGVASAVIRTNLTQITGGTIVYEAWLTW